MMEILRPVLAAIVACAVAVFATGYAFSLWPAPSAWSAVGAVLPELLQIGGFLLCLATAIAGVATAVANARTARERFSRLAHARPPAARERFDPMEEGLR